MSDLSHCKVVIVLFAMDDCPYCEDYSPRFERMIESFRAKGWPFVYYDPRRQFAATEIPIVVVDGASEHPSVDQLAMLHNVEGMPTTLVLRRWNTPIKLEGSVDDRELYDALIIACQASR